MKTIIVPQYFYEQRKFDFIKIDNVSIVNYKIHSCNEKIFVYSSTNLLLFILKGKKTLSFSKGECEAKSGEGLFIKRGNYVMNQIIDIEDGNFESVIISLSDEFLLEFLQKYLNNPECDDKILNISNEYGKFVISDYLISEISTFIFYLNNLDSCKEILKLKIFIMLANIINEDKSGCIKRQLCSLLSNDKVNFKKLMEDNYDKPISIGELAKLSGKSLSAFKVYFKSVYSDTPMNWILKKRLEKAEYLLVTSENSITEICFMVGFENLSHFIKLFKKHYNQSPGQYRKQCSTLNALYQK